MEENTFTDKSLNRIRNIHHDDFLDYLSSAYGVLRKIFSYLSIDDLENVSEAFERWRPIVETTKKERYFIESFIISSRSILFLEVWTLASFCITFSLTENKDRKIKLSKHLREDAQFIMIQTNAGIIGTPKDCSNLIQQRMFRCNTPTTTTPLATHLRIPSFPNVGIKTFTWSKSISFKDFRNSFSLPEKQIIKCLLILITVQDNDRTSGEQKDDFVLFLESTQSESFAVGGCLVDSFFWDPDKQSDKPITKYIVFYGDGVEAASIILKQDVKTKEKIELRIEELKTMCPKTNQGVIFVFSCCSRNKIFRQYSLRKGINEWEGDSLMKHFPCTPMVGCFGYGEFGRKFPDKENSKSQAKKKRQCDIWEYSYSTSIVYVGFKY